MIDFEVAVNYIVTSNTTSEDWRFRVKKNIQKKRVWVLTKNNEIWERYTHQTKKQVIQDVESSLGQFFYNSWMWKSTGFKIKMDHIIIESKVTKK